MDIIYECVENFKHMLNKQYVFTVSKNWEVIKFTLDFEISDFRHATGLDYVDDIEIESNPVKLVEAISDGKITDDLLETSDKYKRDIKEGSSPKSRVEEFRYLERYLDKSDFIRIFKVQPFGSLIKAEYFIEARDSLMHTTVYIFMRKRKENDNYVIVSFFKKINPFIGTTLYWMLKQKIENGNLIELYRKSTYTEE